MIVARDGGFTYDAGALIAAEKGNRRMWKLHRDLVEQGAKPVVPAAVLAQVWRGGSGRQALVARMLGQCRFEPLGLRLAKRMGVACVLLGAPDVVDLSVVIGALDRRDTVVTTDPGDMLTMADVLGRKLEVLPI